MVQNVANQPVNNIHWVPRETLRPNRYNPNHVPPPEFELLKISLLEDGWTQPLVARKDGELVDGFHRWKVAGDPEVSSMTNGLVPVVWLPDGVSRDHQMMSTIRHNRARGNHAVLKMADIVRDLIDEYGLTPAKVIDLLGMDDEEVDRLYDRGGMIKRGSREQFGKAWIPDHQ